MTERSVVAHVYVAEFERDLMMLERMMAALEAARSRRRDDTSGPRALDEGKAELARKLKDERKHSVEVDPLNFGGWKFHAL